MPLVQAQAGAVTRGPGHAIEIAREAARAGYSPIVGIGGDGLLNEITNGLLRSATSAAMGAVAAGSGNDFARSMGLPTDPRVALAVACSSSAERTIDVLACGDRFGLNAAGVGFDARVAHAAARVPRVARIGWVPYVAGILREVGRGGWDRVRLDLDGQVVEREVLLVAVANCRYYGGGIPVCPTASAFDGVLDLCVIGRVSRREILGLLPRVYRGTHTRHPSVEFFRARKVRIEGLAEPDVQIDGELLRQAPVTVTCVPAALRVKVPRSSLSYS